MSEQRKTMNEIDLTTATSAAIQVDGLTKEFETPERTEVVFQDISFEIEPGSFVSLVGRSGSGKSTLLNIVCGFMEPSLGQVKFESNGKFKDSVTIGHVFQEPRLLPWNTCIENIEYVHESNSNYSEEVAKQALDLVGLSDHYHKYPTQLSGGQQQRVGIARALSIDPEILLMDEPFSNLDEITAEQLREELIDIWNRLKKTVLFVTHDLTEAIVLSDRILMLGDGQLYGDLTIDLDRPRDVASNEFLRFREETLNKFHSIE